MNMAMFSRKGNVDLQVPIDLIERPSVGSELGKVKVMFKVPAYEE